MKTSKSFYFSILELIRSGKNPAFISKELGVSKQRMNYYLSRLKEQGCIEKVNYGVWKFLKNWEKRSKSFNPKALGKEVKKRGGGDKSKKSD